MFLSESTLNFSVVIILINFTGVIQGNFSDEVDIGKDISGSPAFASEPGNVQKVFRKVKKVGNESNPSNSELLVTVNIPKNFANKTYFPHLKFINDSTEINEQNETLADNGAMISGVATRFGKRSVRSYPSSYYQQPFHHQYPARFSSPNMMHYTGSGRYYKDKYPYRYDRNGIDRVSDASSSWGGNWLNKLKRRTSMMMNPGMPTMDRNQMMMNMMNEEGTAEEPDMAGSFISGWGPLYSKSKVNKSAVGLLGFLSILSLIQNVLNQTMPMQRRRRDIQFESEVGDSLSFLDDGVTLDIDRLGEDTLEVISLVLPMVNAVNAAQNGELPMECTFLPICSGNEAIARKFHEKGRAIGMALSDELSKTLKNAGKRWKSVEENLTSKIIRAGMSGRNGKNCSEKYKRCMDTTAKSHFPIPKQFTKFFVNE